MSPDVIKAVVLCGTSAAHFTRRRPEFNLTPRFFASHTPTRPPLGPHPHAMSDPNLDRTIFAPVRSRIFFASRWPALPLYVGLIAAAVYVFIFEGTGAPHEAVRSQPCSAGHQY
jgi:hypothetical protein